METETFTRKNKALVILAVVIAATSFGVLVFTVSASEDLVPEEVSPFLRRLPRHWMHTLTNEQRTTLKAIIKENHAEIHNQIEAWGAEFSELTNEQHEILKLMIEANHTEVKAQLEAWGIELPACQGPMGLLDGLTDEQKEELQTMRQSFREAVKAKLEEWGIDIQDIDGPPACGMEFRGKAARGFGLFKP